MGKGQRNRDQRRDHAAALSVQCPTCGRGHGHNCTRGRKKNTPKMKVPHRERIEAGRGG